MFKWLQGYEGHYGVTSQGEILGYESGRFYPIPTVKDCKGYLECQLPTKDKIYRVKVHKKVARAFLTKPKGKSLLVHKNGNKSDNRVENLAYMTFSEKFRQFNLNPVRGESHYKYDHKKYIFRHPEYGTVECTQWELADRYNLHKSSLWQVLKKKRISCSGWVLLREL